MAVHVIDDLETVHVDEGEDELPVRAAGPVDLPLEIGQATVTSKRPGQAVNACLLAVAGRLLTITRSRGSVAGRGFAVAGRLLALSDSEAAVRPYAVVGRSIAFVRRMVTQLGHAIASAGSVVALVATACEPAGPRLQEITNLGDAHREERRLAHSLVDEAMPPRLLFAE